MTRSTPGGRCPLRHRGRAALALLVALLVLAPPGRAQTEEDVRQAVRDCIGLTPVHTEARERLETWGNAALPTLARLAESPGDLDSLHVLAAITQVPTQEAVDLLVARLETERAGGMPSMVLAQLHMLTTLRGHQLAANPDLQRAVLGRLEAEQSSVNLQFIADLAAALGWADAVEPLRPLLDHPDQAVRRGVAAALTRLTGEDVSIEEPPRSFPRTDLGSVSVRLLGSCPGRDALGLGLAFVSWPVDGREQHLLLTARRGGGLQLVDERMAVVHEIQPPSPRQDLLLLPREDAATPPLLCSVAPGGTVVAHDLEGRELWSYDVPSRGTRSLAALTHRGVVRGVVVGAGGDDGVIALDLSGEVLWQLRGRHVLYQVETHPDLDVVFVVGGSVEVVDAFGRPQADAEVDVASRHGRTSPLRRRVPDAPHIYTRLLRAFPDVDGQPASIVAGDGNHSVATLGRRDADLRSVWAATVPGRIGGLGLLEPEGRPRLVACAADDGMVYLCTEDGTLVWETRIPHASRRVFVGAVEAGRLGDTWAFAISTLGETLVYALGEAGER